MELRQLEYFVAVAEEGHFNAAAARCHVVRSGMSASIRALERELGTKLFVRTTREVRLTDAGAALLGEARRTLAAAAAALDDVGSVLRGTLSIGISQPNRTVDLSAVLAVFHDTYPAVTVSVTRATSISLLDQVTRGTIDLALTYLPTRLPKTLRVEVLDAGAMVLVSNPDHRFANRSSVSLQELRGENFVKVPMDWATRSIVDEAHDRAGIERVSWVEVNDLNTLLEFVGSGLGIAIVPGPESRRAETSRVADEAEQTPAVTYVPLVPRGPAWTFGIVTNGSRSSNPAARAFTETLKRLRPDAGSLSLTVDDDQIGLRG